MKGFRSVLTWNSSLFVLTSIVRVDFGTLSPFAVRLRYRHFAAVRVAAECQVLERCSLSNLIVSGLLHNTCITVSIHGPAMAMAMALRWWLNTWLKE